MYLDGISCVIMMSFSISATLFTQGSHLKILGGKVEIQEAGTHNLAVFTRCIEICFFVKR